MLRGSESFWTRRAMQRFIARENIKRFREMLADTTDEQKRETLSQLLSDEEARLARLDGESKPAPEPASSEGSVIH